MSLNFDYLLILNLPEIVQFKDGHQIINAYDASGKKLSSRYYTILMRSQVPVVNTLQPGQVLNLQYEMDYIGETGTFYLGNIEYGFDGCDPGWYWIDKIYNPEGYVNNLGIYSGPHYQYYRKDHLGNNREVWLANTNTAIQRTQYYPSGLPWAESTGASLQPYKFNGCEFIEMHGLDVTDLGNRGVHHAKNRFDTMDRFCEKFPWQSPYVHAGNNPVNYVDVNGDSIVLTGDNVQQTIMAIYNGMADGTKVNMRFNNGVLDPSSIADQTQNISDFFLKDLYEIAINPQMVELSIKGTFDYKDNDGNTRNSHDGSTPLLEWTTPYDYSDDDDPKIKQDAIYRGDYKQGKTVQGGTGRTLFTVSNTGQRSTNDNIQIIVNANGSINHRTIGLFHEFQHVLLKFREQKYTHSDPGVTDIIENGVILMKRRLGYDY